MRILFYAINHVGLGHVVRLSIVQRFLTEQNLAECHFFSESSHAASFFSCPGILIDAAQVSAKERWRRLETGVRRAVDALRPDVLVCDTYFAEAAASLPTLRRRGGRAVLMLRMTDSELMAPRLRAARTLFDRILLPHHPREVEWAYRHHPRLLRRLDSPQVVPVGPLCRTTTRPARTKEIIFSVGAGGEWPGASKANTIGTFLGAYADASRLLTDHGYTKPTLAAGTFMRLSPEHRARFVVRRTSSLHEHYGPRTTVVTRGGYNTVWEAVSAKSPLVVCGTRTRLDDVKARSEFVELEGLGRSVPPDGEAIFKAIVGPWDAHSQAVKPWAGIVNSGLAVVADELLGGAFLRAEEPKREYPASSAAAIMKAKRKRLIARFEDVDAQRPSAAVRAAARLATELGYDTRLCSATDSGADDCVSVLVWPGPRVRNELRLSEEITARQKRGVNTGLGIHADRLPSFLVEYLLRAFSLHNV